MKRKTRFISGTAIMNQHFFLWYYTGGFRGMLTFAGNLLRFVVHRFSFGRLFRTIVSPWKRDVVFRNWRGFHPLFFLRKLFDNFISRFLGALLRLGMLCVGAAVLCIVLVIDGVILCLYAGAPLLGIAGFMAFPFLQQGSITSLLLGVAGVVSLSIAYAMRPQDDSLTYDVKALREKRYFKRILARLGLKPGFFEQEALADTQRFLVLLGTLGVDRPTYERAVAIEHDAALRQMRRHTFWSWENLRTIRPLGKDWHYAYTPRLDRYCLDLSKSDPTEYADAELIGRHDELSVATVVFERPTQNSIILVGDPGIGKKTFVHYIARLIRENAFGTSYLDEARVLLFDIGRAVSDALSNGEDVDHTLRELFTEVAYAGNIILAVENIDQYLGNDHSRPNLAPLFNEFLQLPDFRVMATAPTDRYHMLAKDDEQVLKFFDVIYFRETTEEETFDILIRHFERLERKRIVFTIRGIESVIAAAGRYDWETPFPERALDLAQETLLFWQGTDESFITPDVVERFISLKTGVPSGALKEDEKDKLLHLEDLLHGRVVGQHEAVRQVAEAMRKARAGFGDSKRPLGSFIFFGPTGVGKTETAKAFAENYFGSEDKMIRLDMSEFQTQEAISRMIGSRELDVQGELVSAARENPFAILLLDEIEKAYPRVLDLFLQILDEGYVTDGFGEKVSFRNMIIIATSNAGAALIRSLVSEGASMSVIRQQVLDQIVENNMFRLEFLNRFDGIIFFEPLNQTELETVTDLKLKKFAERLKKEKNIMISFAPDVIPKIIEKGFEPEFGARSINRFIENAIEDMVVKKIIAGELMGGGALTVSGDTL